MADCDRYLELMAESLGGELRPEDRSTLEAHLGGCAPCREALSEYEELVEEARDVEVPEPSDIYWNAYFPRLKARLEGEEARRRARWEWLLARPAAALASLAFILLAVFLARTPLDTPASPHVLYSMLELTEPLDTTVSGASILPEVDVAAVDLWPAEAWALAADPELDPFSFLELPGSLDAEEWESLRRSLSDGTGS